MALHVQYEGRVKDWQTACVVKNHDGTYSRTQTFEVMCYAMMLCGVHEITDDNAANVYGRIHAYETLFGTLWKTQTEDVWVTPDQVRAMVGLLANVVQKTDRQFLADMGRIARERASGVLTYDAPRAWSQSTVQSVTVQ